MSAVAESPEEYYARQARVLSAVLLVSDQSTKCIYVNRPQVEKNRAGENGPVWVVEYEKDDEIVIRQAYEVLSHCTLHAAPHLSLPRPDGVSVYLTLEGPVMLRLTPDPSDPDWETAVNFFMAE